MRASVAPDVGPSPGDPAVPMEACPIATTLGTLGRKWTLTILRAVAFYPGLKFTAIRRANPGLRQRTLSLRLKQMQREGLIERADGDARSSGYRLTTKGRDLWPVLSALFDYGIQHHADVVFVDGRPRTLAEVYPGSSVLLTGRLGTYARDEASANESRTLEGGARPAGTSAASARRRSTGTARY
ncbi:MAG: helix-turn-helix transcriptional regulator [Thermoplasmata archaeon]|nr:helix-turn-helix transcriptional regulator [Thermoplasmata archaeon]